MTEYSFSRIPYDRLTWVSAYDKQTLCKKIAAAVYRHDEIGMSRHKFNGRMTDEGEFLLSQRVSHPNLFLPLLHCRIEPASSGCLIFIECSLFFSTRVLLGAGMLLLISAALYFFLQREWLYAATMLVAAVLLYLTVLGNYHLQKQISLNLLQRVIA